MPKSEILRCRPSVSKQFLAAVTVNEAFATQILHTRSRLLAQRQQVFLWNKHRAFVVGDASRAVNVQNDHRPILQMILSAYYQRLYIIRRTTRAKKFETVLELCPFAKEGSKWLPLSRDRHR
jgi:hypothetical protein